MPVPPPLPQNAAMDADLAPVVAALADVADGELAALIEASNGVPQIAPGLSAWIEGACDWEQNRRLGLNFPLLPPEAGIPPEEDAVSIVITAMLRAVFTRDQRTGAVISLFDAVLASLTGCTQRH